MQQRVPKDVKRKEFCLAILYPLTVTKQSSLCIQGRGDWTTVPSRGLPGRWFAPQLKRGMEREIKADESLTPQKHGGKALTTHNCHLVYSDFKTSTIIKYTIFQRCKYEKKGISELPNYGILITFFLSSPTIISSLTFQTSFFHLLCNLIAKLSHPENILITVLHNIVLLRTRLLMLVFKMSQKSQF